MYDYSYDWHIFGGSVQHIELHISHFLHVIKYITSVEIQERFCLILCTHGVVLLVKQSDSFIVKKCEQLRLLNLDTADLFIF